MTEREKHLLKEQEKRDRKRNNLDKYVEVL